MTFRYRLVFIMILFLGGCDGSVSLDDSLKKYALPDNSKAYTKLVDRDPAQLSPDELYNRSLTLWDTPYRELSVPTSIGVAHIIVSGPEDGEVLVLLHGMNASSTMWYPNAASLSKHYRVYAIDDIVGGGKSEPSKELESMDQIIGWYSEIFKILGLKQIHLVGASRGGWMAIKIALTDTTRIKSVALLSPAQTFAWITPSMGLVDNLTFALNPKRENLRDALETMSVNVDGISQLYIDQYYSKTKQGNLPQFLLDMRPFDKKHIRQLEIPVLVIVGDQDIINDEDTLENAEEALPKVKTHFIKNGGHFINIDQAAAVNSALNSFIGETIF